MTLKWTAEGKVDRKIRTYGTHQPDFDALADALDECVAALRAICSPWTNSDSPSRAFAINALRKLGVEP